MSQGANSTTAQAVMAEFDIILVNTSGGKDSQAILDVVVKQARAEGVADRLVAVHATFAEEWAGTEELAREQAAHYGLPLHVVQHSKGSLLARVRERGKWMDSAARFCTAEFKRNQVAKLMTALVKAHPMSGVRPVRVLNCMGIRAAESVARQKKNPFHRDEMQSNGRRDVWTYYPIFDWSVAQVWECIRQAGTRVHPAYAAGMPRLSCVFCVFAPKAALMLAGKLNPELLAEYVKVEAEINHDFKRGFKIAEVQDALARGEQPAAITTWEM